MNTRQLGLRRIRAVTKALVAASVAGSLGVAGAVAAGSVRAAAPNTPPVAANPGVGASTDSGSGSGSGSSSSNSGSGSSGSGSSGSGSSNSGSSNSGSSNSGSSGWFSGAPGVSSSTGRGHVTSGGS
jgi:hypothetical protein